MDVFKWYRLRMGTKSALLLFYFGCFVAVTSKTIEDPIVNVTSEWRNDIGWEVTCSWQLSPDDSLQSVRLRDDGRQFMIFRPEKDGPKISHIFHRPDNNLQVDCFETTEKGQMGKCVLTLELYQPMIKDATYTCEVSGERPYFKMENKDIVVEGLVPPSKAEVTGYLNEDTGRVTANCSSSGSPAPNFIWTIGDQKIPQDFSRSTWNATSKLWHGWSLMSYTPNNEVAVCTPVVNKEGKLVRGEPVPMSGVGCLSGLSYLLLLSIVTLLLTSRYR